MEQVVEVKKNHTRPQTIIFLGKAKLLQLRRGLENLFDKNLKKFSRSDELAQMPVAAESVTPLWTETSAAEKFLTAGKIQNLRIAARHINGLEIPAGGLFSFWRQIGRAGAGRGFVTGRELREGCLIPNIGGGLCQLSNALYDAALSAGFEIVERHAHTQVIAGSLAEKGRDATVFWNYVDLRFRARQSFRIEAFLTAENLIVRLKCVQERPKKVFEITRRREKAAEVENCTTCGVGDCFRMVKPSNRDGFGRTAFLVDEFSPEIDKYLQKVRREKKDLLFVPLDGGRFRKANYAWTTKGFAGVRQSFRQTLERAYKSRKLARQGAERQQNLLNMAEKLTDSYAKKLPFDALHLVVSQNLLPFLWQKGILGGRTFDVLMTGLPLETLQKHLDRAFERHPESTTLSDFRVSADFVRAETEALANARRIITPHTEIAALFPARTVLLDWERPSPKSFTRIERAVKTVVFPASTVGRKGIYELREALHGLNIRLITLGAIIEDENFWVEFDQERMSFADDWLAQADAVVLPALVENRPRAILQALVCGVPAVVSKACGLSEQDGLEIVETGESVELKLKLQKILSR